MAALTVSKPAARRGRKHSDPRWAKQWRIDRERGLTRTVDAGLARAHIWKLRAQGMTFGSIAEAAKCSRTTIADIASTTRRKKKVFRTIEARILAVVGPLSVLVGADVDQAPHTLVPSLGARRRVRALMAMGWSHEQMLSISGVRTEVLLSQRGSWVTCRNHLRVDQMFQQLHMTPGGNQRAADYARRHGYPPPLAWDDIDDPLEQPSLGQSERGVDLAEVEWLQRQGFTLDQAAERLGVSRAAIEKAKWRVRRAA